MGCNISTMITLVDGVEGGRTVYTRTLSGSPLIDSEIKLLVLVIVIPDVERVFDDAPDQLRREAAGELGREDSGECVEVGALIGAEAARRDHFLDVGVGCLRREDGAGAKEDREEAAVGVANCRA